MKIDCGLVESPNYQMSGLLLQGSPLFCCLILLQIKVITKGKSIFYAGLAAIGDFNYHLVYLETFDCQTNTSNSAST
jgi:hypothetical protein